MKNRIAVVSIVGALLMCVAALTPAQDLGPQVKRIRDGIYVYAAKAQDSNVNIILTQDGVVLIDTGQGTLSHQRRRRLARGEEKLIPQEEKRSQIAE